MKEMIKALIADGWEWVACDADRKKSIYLKKPHLNHCKDAFKPDFSAFTTIPSCLFPDITFENSPVELKTLLVDDGEEVEKEQKRIKDLLEHGFVYIINVIDGNIVCVGGDDKYFIFGSSDKDIFSKHCNEVYEKVYLKDLVKKRKVKKSIWLCADENGSMFICTNKPNRGKLDWLQNGGEVSKITNEVFQITWEDEPIELTYEVEEQS